MKILHIGEFVRGGVATYIDELLCYQIQDTAITDLRLLLDLRSEGIVLTLGSENIYYYNYDRQSARVLTAIFQIRSYIRTFQPDIVHVHSSHAGFLTRFPYLLGFKRPKVVYCAHGWSFNMEIPSCQKRLLAFVEKTLARETDLIINVSRYEHDSACAYNLPAGKMTVICSGVRERKECAPALSLDNEFINLLFAGRFDKQKGLDILLQVFSKYRFEKIKLYLIGESVLGNMDINIPAEVVNLGWIDSDKIDSYYSSFDAVLIPSRWEGFGLVAVEAMRNHKPVIASRRCSLPELVTHGVNGYLFDPEDEPVLVDLLKQLDKTILRQMGQRAYEIYKERFSSQYMNSAIVNKYQQLLDR